jgi:hypothetical protein
LPSFTGPVAFGVLAVTCCCTSAKMPAMIGEANEVPPAPDQVLGLSVQAAPPYPLVGSE